uniref:EPIDERMAL PATTERNING FACTOR-like protein 2 n=1 Tax=Erigeron canadensis TaxID=72917 RepID=UPI001CB92670|nr:EPIDERMAL PATTERNING FACTOR-like protein 2 [Erigeron canadensis]
MGCGHNPKLLIHHHHHHLTIYPLLFLSILFTAQFISFAQGRVLIGKAANSHSQVDEEKTILRGQIGSRPPRCERRCGSCGHCEAIQVPTTPQTKTTTNEVINPKAIATIAYARGDYTSNYKPMSWKCKCGSFLFNP